MRPFFWGQKNNQRQDAPILLKSAFASWPFSNEPWHLLGQVRGEGRVGSGSLKLLCYMTR